ncbi:MAG: YceI family protein [Flavobacteriaceae bacterium]
MINKLITLIFLMFISFGYSQDWNQKKNQTKVVFKIKNFGLTVDGDFSSVVIKTNFDASNLKQSYITATIPVKSISTGNKSRDKHLLKKDYFNESNFKNITLKSTKISKNVDGIFILYADLTIKGKVEKVEIPMQISKIDSTLSIKANFQINRKIFNVGGGSFILSKTVKIQVTYSGTK